MAQTKTLITVGQFPEIAGGRRVELVRGELQEMTPIGVEHFDVVGQLLSLIVPFVKSRKLGLAGPELGCILSRDPDIIRAPDAAFVSASRLASGNRKGFFEGAPDLVVEVLSPSDRASEIQQKVQEYLQAGSQLVWVIDPESKTVTAFRPTGEAHVYRGSDTVPGAPVLPGFSFQPDVLFNIE